jgi:hypothetical protein
MASRVELLGGWDGSESSVVPANLEKIGVKWIMIVKNGIRLNFFLWL